MRQDLGSAGEALERALTLDPQDITARHHLALTLLALGEPEEAAAQFEQILEITPDSSAARLDLGAIRMSQRRFEEARGQFAAVVECEPENQRAAFHLGAALLQTGDQARGWALLEKVAQGQEDKYSVQARRLIAARKETSASSN